MSKASRVEQANEWAVRTNERTNKQVAQYLRLDSWFFWTTAGHVMAHDREQAITQKWFKTYHEGQACDEEEEREEQGPEAGGQEKCPFSGKEIHFHCKKVKKDLHFLRSVFK